MKSGTIDPDFSDIPLGGWAGTVQEVDQRSAPPMYLIAWNQQTLDQMHPVYRKRCERDGLELESIWLGEEDIEPDTGTTAVIELPTNVSARPLDENDQDDRVRAILGLTSDDPLSNVRRRICANTTCTCQATCHSRSPPPSWRKRVRYGSRRIRSPFFGCLMLVKQTKCAACFVRHDMAKTA